MTVCADEFMGLEMHQRASLAELGSCDPNNLGLRARALVSPEHWALFIQKGIVDISSRDHRFVLTAEGSKLVKLCEPVARLINERKSA